MKTGHIYAITSPTLKSVYIGSTWETIERRFSRHRSDFKRWLKGTYGYCSSFKILANCDDAYIELLDSVSLYGDRDAMRKQLRIVEQEWIDFYEEVAVNNIRHTGGLVKILLKGDTDLPSPDCEEFGNSHIGENFVG